MIFYTDREATAKRPKNDCQILIRDGFVFLSLRIDRPEKKEESIYYHYIFLQRGLAQSLHFSQNGGACVSEELPRARVARHRGEPLAESPPEASEDSLH